MFRIKIFTWEKTKDVACQGLVEKYEKFLRSYAKVEWEVAKEGIDIAKTLEKYPDTILVSDEGKEFDSVEFAEFIGERLNGGSGELVFVIGGTFGFSDMSKSKFKYSISLSQMTYPHELARIMLLEQIYRAVTILERKEYHY